MINIKAKREKMGMITHLKSEYGNIFSRETVIDTIKKGFKYCIFSDRNTYDYICIIENDNGVFLCTDGLNLLNIQEVLKDNIDSIDTF